MVSGLPRVPHPDFARSIVHRFTLLVLSLLMAANVFLHDYVNPRKRKNEGAIGTLKQHYAVMN
jgi:hypothetical protein